MTIAATLATAPLIAFHFEELSTDDPARQPAGAAGGGAGDVAGDARRGRRPGPRRSGRGAQRASMRRCSPTSPRSPPGAAGPAGPACTCASASAACRLLRRRSPPPSSRSPHLAAPPPRSRRPRQRLHRPRGRGLSPDSGTNLSAIGLGWPPSAAASALARGWRSLAPAGRRATPAPPPGLRVSVLDVGQGDAILLQPRGAPAVLVDGGPPGDGLGAEAARRRGSSGSAPRSSPTTSPTTPAGSGSCSGRCRSSASSTACCGVDPRAGPRRRGRHRPPRARRRAARRAAAARRALAAAGAARRPARGEDPNPLALVALARWRGFSMLLTADAEAEAVPLDPGPVDVLKVAHHGSDDAGLGALLERTRPRLAVISVGAGNPYGHPTPGTLATLAAHGVPVLRTDRDGTVEIDVEPRRLPRGDRRLRALSAPAGWTQRIFESILGFSRPWACARRSPADGRSRCIRKRVTASAAAEPARSLLGGGMLERAAGDIPGPARGDRRRRPGDRRVRPQPGLAADRRQRRSRRAPQGRTSAAARSAHGPPRRVARVPPPAAGARRVGEPRRRPARGWDAAGGAARMRRP